jgi:activator of HSP90 ATPase
MPAVRKKSASVNEVRIKAAEIEQVVFIPAPPARVYKAYLDEQEHSAMTGGAAKLEPREGGTFSAWDGYINGTILQLEKGKKIVQDWITTEWPEGYARSFLSLTFTPKNNGTELHLIQEGVPASMVKEYKNGWKEYYWKPMKKYFSAQHKKGTAIRSPRKKK